MGHNDALNPNIKFLVVDHLKGDLPGHLQVFLRALGGLQVSLEVKKMTKNGAKLHILE